MYYDSMMKLSKVKNLKMVAGMFLTMLQKKKAGFWQVKMYSPLLLFFISTFPVSFML